MTGLHHLELWVPDLAEARRSWGWLLSELGWTVADLGGTTFEAHHDDVYLFVEQSPRCPRQPMTGWPAPAVRRRVLTSRILDLWCPTRGEAYLLSLT